MLQPPVWAMLVPALSLCWVPPPHDLEQADHEVHDEKDEDPDEARLVVGEDVVGVVGVGVVGQDRLPHFLVCLLEHWDLLGGH